MSTSRACKTCQWWLPNSGLADATLGLCRAHPPTVDGGVTRWPVVHADDWCGTHQIRAELVGGDVRNPRSQETAS